MRVYFPRAALPGKRSISAIAKVSEAISCPAHRRCVHWDNGEKRLIIPGCSKKHAATLRCAGERAGIAELVGGEGIEPPTLSV